MASTKIIPTDRGVNPDRLSDKQRKFVDLYLADPEMNASKAAKEAGYAGKNAANQLMNDPKVVAYLGKRTKEVSEATKIEVNHVVLELANMAFSNPQDYIGPDGDYLPLQELPRHLASCISEVIMGNRYDEAGKIVGKKVVGYKLYDKVGPLQLLGRHLGMFDERLKVDIQATGKLEGALAAILEAASGRSNIVDGSKITELAATDPEEDE